MADRMRPAEILLIEDDPADIRLTQETMRFGKLRNNLHVATDGVEGLRFLRREEEHANAPTPDLILLDLNMPRMDGREFLATVRADDDLRHLPIVVLTASDAEEDVLKAYRLNCNCYVRKPLDLSEFGKIVQALDEFWLMIATLPPTPT